MKGILFSAALIRSVETFRSRLNRGKNQPRSLGDHTSILEEKFLTTFRLSKTGPGCKDQCLTGGLVGEINHCSMVICRLLVKIFALGVLLFSDENFLVSHLPKFFSENLPFSIFG